MKPYEHYKIFGPYVGKDNRKRIVVVNNSIKTTISYPKYLVEVSIGRYLNVDEQIHHKDGNFLNNNLDNLEIVKLKEHQHFHNPGFIKEQEAICVWCGKRFLMTKSHAKSRRDKRNKYGPFCSKRCSGLYGVSIQLGIIV